MSFYTSFRDMPTKRHCARADGPSRSFWTPRFIQDREMSGRSRSQLTPSTTQHHMACLVAFSRTCAGLPGAPCSL
jgi:hypothetical protein